MTFLQDPSKHAAVLRMPSTKSGTNQAMHMQHLTRVIVLQPMPNALLRVYVSAPWFGSVRSRSAYDALLTRVCVVVTGPTSQVCGGTGTTATCCSAGSTCMTSAQRGSAPFCCALRRCPLLLMTGVQPMYMSRLTDNLCRLYCIACACSRLLARFSR